MIARIQLLVYFFSHSSQSQSALVKSMEQMQQTKVDMITNANKEMERLRLFIKHLSYIEKHSKDSYNITKSVIKEIDSFKMDDITISNEIDQLSLISNGTKDITILYKNLSKEINYLRKIINELSSSIMNRYHLQKLKEYRPFRNYWDEKEFEDIFMASLFLNLPFNIHYTISLFAVGKIKKCFNPHKIDKELLILNENQHKEWFIVDYPEKAIVCKRCFCKYVKQCDGCKQIVLSCATNSLKMDGKWYCTTTFKCIFGFSDDYRNP